MKAKMTAVLMLSGLLAATVAPQVGLAQAIDLETLTECSDRAWEEDIAAWPSYAFDRAVTRRSLDSDGKVESRELLRFRITPKGEGFDEVLVMLDGKKPSDREVKKYRDKEIFTRHQQQAEELELANPIGENLALLPILAKQEYRLVGEDEINGHACYRVVFDARPEPKDADTLKQLEYAVSGSACFSIEGCHTVAFEMETVRPLKQGPAKLEHLQISLESGPVGDAWLINRVELHSDFSVLGKKLRRFNSIRYSNFTRQGK